MANRAKGHHPAGRGRYLLDLISTSYRHHDFVTADHASTDRGTERGPDRALAALVAIVHRGVEEVDAELEGVNGGVLVEDVRGAVLGAEVGTEAERRGGDSARELTEMLGGQSPGAAFSGPERFTDSSASWLRAGSRWRAAQLSGAPNKPVAASASIVPDAVVPRNSYRLKQRKTQSRMRSQCLLFTQVQKDNCVCNRWPVKRPRS